MLVKSRPLRVHYYNVVVKSHYIIAVRVHYSKHSGTV